MIRSYKNELSMPVHLTPLTVRAKDFDVKPAESFEKAVEANVALSAEGFAKIESLAGKKLRAVTERSDLYIEAWDGRDFLFAKEARAHAHKQ